MTELHQTNFDKVFDVACIITIFCKELSTSRRNYEEIYDFWEMVYMEEGAAVVRIGDTTHYIQAGQLLFYPPGISHQIVDNLNQTCKIGLISFRCSSEAMSSFKNKSFVLKASEKNMLIRLLHNGTAIFKWFESDCVQKGMYAANDTTPAQLFKLKLNFEMFLTCIYTDYQAAVSISDFETARKRHQNKETFNIVKTYLMQNIDRCLTVEEISKGCLIGVSTLKRILREELGCGVIDYFNDLKIEKAAELIRSSSMNVSQIAEKLGFSSQSYFSRLFKKKLEVSPLEYSKSLD